MTPTQVFSREDLAGLLEGQGYDYPEREQALRLIDRWVERGDGCAVYRNEEIGSLNLGDLKFVSFGGPSAQLETDGETQPPIRLPDIGSEINWRYVLYGTYRPGQTGNGPTEAKVQQVMDQIRASQNATITDITKNHPSNSDWSPIVDA